MSILYLDGIRFKNGLISGFRQVIAQKDYLNKINVFPVPDGDTGTNMAFTLLGIQNAISRQTHSNINEMSQIVAESALDGARGNSGAILAQFFVGVADGLNNKIRVNAIDFTNAVKKGKLYAYDALITPKEGTILTVINDWVDELEKLSQQLDNFKIILEKALHRAKISLKETTSKLEVLAKAGVVDAGAQGFVELLNGIQQYIDSGFIPEHLQVNEDANNVFINKPEILEEFQFCTECLIDGKEINRVSLKEEIMNLGNSIILGGTKNKIKLHIHTNNPKIIFEICAKYGIVSSEKADDMLQQQTDVLKVHENIALVVDSGCDLPEEILHEYNIHMVPVRLNFGDKHYVDKLTITTKEFWDEVKSNPINPTTSQPTPGDFKRQYQFLSGHYKSAISLHLPSKLSGTYQSAITAAKGIPDFQIKVIEAFNGSVGMGLIAIRIIEAIKKNKTIEEVEKIANQAITNCNVYVSLDTLEFVVRGGRLPASKKRLADLLKLNPILTFTENGVKASGFTFGSQDKFKKFKKFISKKIPKIPFRVGIAHAVAEENAVELKNFFKSIKECDEVIFTNIGPALGAHSGPNAIAVAIQTLNDDLSN
ncbi:MAG: DegV family EDD domain-containing protein [Bacteroidetes bacterium]|nr:DegV family EDD domain-containing protein [Bacteroidota bacterium]